MSRRLRRWIALPSLALVGAGFLGLSVPLGVTTTVAASNSSLGPAGHATSGAIQPEVGAESMVGLSQATRAASSLSPAVRPSSPPIPPSMTSATGTNVGGAYTALAPDRLLDTRSGSGYPGAGQTLGPNSALPITVTGPGADGVPSTATAVALDVTVTDATAASYLSVYPVGGTQPLVSNLNWAPGETVPNLVIVPVGSGGQVNLYNHAGVVDVVVDLEGYFAPEPSGTTAGSYVPLTPSRITDTRPDSGSPNAGQSLGPSGSLSIQVTGAGAVPSSTSAVEAVLLNVTVTGTTAASYLTVYPEGGTEPTASNLNWVAGETVANRVVVPISSSTGQVTVFNHAGTADVVVDVDGYFSAGTAPAGAGLYTPIIPVRVIDTRTGSNQSGEGQTLGPSGILTEPLGSVGHLGSDLTAVVTNVTTTDTTAPSFLTVYPGPSLPLASDLNWTAGQTAANLTVATVSDTGSLSFYNQAGSADLVVDVFGYFSLSIATLDSGNWSGYGDGNGPNTAVTGTFTVPSLDTGQTGTNMAEWVGIDGWTNSSLIQAGIDESPDPNNSNLFYLFPWWEILPASATPITLAQPLKAGDSVTIDIAQVSGSLWSITLTDDTTGSSFNTMQTYTGPGSSAEWIVEAPTDSSTGNQYPLAAYTPTTMTGISVVGSDTVEPAIVMVQNSVVVSVPSAPGQGGSSFNVAYGAVAPDPP